MGFLGDYVNPNMIGRGLGSYAGRTIGKSYGGQEGADIGGNIGGHLGAGAGALIRGENPTEVAKQSFAPISPFIGSKLGQYVGGKFGAHGADVGSQFGNQLGIGAGALMYGKDPYQVARQTALGMLPGVASALAGPGAYPQNQTSAQPNTGYPVAQPAPTGFAQGGYVDHPYAPMHQYGGGGYEDQTYASGGTPMDAYYRTVAHHDMNQRPQHYAYGGNVQRRPNLMELMELMPPRNSQMY